MYAITSKSSPLRNLILSSFLFALSACGGNGGSDDNGGNTVTQYTVGGSVTGMAGTGLILQNNNRDNLNIDSDQTFIFPTSLDDGADYSVSVMTHPVGPDQACLVKNGSGTINGAHVTDVAVECQAASTGGDCDSGSIVFNHDVSNNYLGFWQDALVTGFVPFSCDDSNNISGSGSLIVSVTGGTVAQCLTCTWTGNAAVDVDMSGALVGSIITLQLEESWYVGSPSVSGSCEDTCNPPDITPYQYPLLETPILHTLEFPDIDGYTLQAPYSGANGSGTYNWTLNIQ